MLQYVRKWLTILLTIVSITTLINVLVMYWIPIVIPFGSFSAIRLTFIAFTEKRYYLIGVSIVISFLLLAAAISVRKKKIFWPTISLAYLLCDFGIVFYLFLDGIYEGYGYWRTYVFQTVILIVLIALMWIYCYFLKKLYKSNCKQVK